MSQQILIVEDDPFAQKFYHYLFKKTDYEILLLENGDEIVYNLVNNHFKLIIMDINLTNTYLEGEKIDGIKLSRVIKKNDSLSNIPILLVTAYTGTKEEKKYFEQSLADAYITKPINDYNDLLSKIEELILD